MKCGYTRQSYDIGPDTECPRCGAIYSKVEAKIQTEGMPMKTETPAPKARPPRPPKKIPVSGSANDCLTNEISLLIRSHYGLIFIRTMEEDRARSILWHLASSLNMPLYTWSANYGLCRADGGQGVYGTTDPKLALDHIVITRSPGVYHFQGLEPFLNEPALTAKLDEAVLLCTQTNGALVLTGSDCSLPESIKINSAEITPPPPDRQEYIDLLNNILRDLKSRQNVSLELSRTDLGRLLNNLKGLTLLETEKILTKAIIEDGKLNARDIQVVVEAKKNIVERDGLLEYFPVEQSLSDIAGMAHLKDWLAKRKAIIMDPLKAKEFGLTFPKGILLLGVPGSGKSLCAKAVAMEWGLPLLKMDPSSLYNKYIGESERNFKRAMETAEKMSPVILWIDEIEKAFMSGGTEDGGTSQRVLGSFLSWMQDRTGDVFVVATANDVEKLPPEFLRKGRFDEIFFVDLPDPESLAAIFSIHLKRRKKDPARFDIGKLSHAALGFTGAEVEQAIVSAMYHAFSRSEDLTTRTVLDEIGRTKPLSVTRAEELEELRSWARERTVNAH